MSNRGDKIVEMPGEFREEMEQSGQFITNYIILFETSNGKNRSMNLSFSEEMTPWLARGMIDFGGEALQRIGDRTSNGEDI